MGRRQEQKAGAEGRSRRQVQEAGAGGRWQGQRQEQEQETSASVAALSTQDSGLSTQHSALRTHGLRTHGLRTHGLRTQDSALSTQDSGLSKTRPANQITAEAERSKSENDPAGALRMMLPYLGAGILWLLLFLAALAWAIFYYPMALAVAGYTQSFGSVINPLVGLDTIRRMGSTYFKAFGMVVLVQVVALVLGSIVAYITSPLALPFLGNLPAKFIDGTLMFYFNLVIACLLGLSLYKCADHLGISTD